MWSYFVFIYTKEPPCEQAKEICSDIAISKEYYCGLKKGLGFDDVKTLKTRILLFLLTCAIRGLVHEVSGTGRNIITAAIVVATASTTSNKFTHYFTFLKSACHVSSTLPWFARRTKFQSIPNPRRIFPDLYKLCDF